MKLHYAEATTHDERDAPFALMGDEGLIPWAMSSFTEPTLDDWRRVTAEGVLLCCREGDGQGRLLGCGHFMPFRGQVWEFEFTAFRAGFACAAAQARGGFAHMFERHGASALIGITPAAFLHAWGLAGACGLDIVKRLPGACWLARKQQYVDGVMVVCTPQTLRMAQKGA